MCDVIPTPCACWVAVCAVCRFRSMNLGILLAYPLKRNRKATLFQWKLPYIGYCLRYQIATTGLLVLQKLLMHQTRLLWNDKRLTRRTRSMSSYINVTFTFTAFLKVTILISFPNKRNICDISDYIPFP